MPERRQGIPVIAGRNLPDFLMADRRSRLLGEVAGAADDSLIADGLGSRRRVFLDKGSGDLDLPQRLRVVKIKPARLKPQELLPDIRSPPPVRLEAPRRS